MSEIYIDTKILTRISKFVSELIGRTLTGLENNKLIDFAEENKKYLDAKNDVELVAGLASEYANTLETSDSSNSVTAAKLNDADLSNFLGVTDINQFIMEINPKARKRIAHICLDSRYARFSQDCKHLQWDVFESLSEGLNSTNVVGQIRNITNVRCASIVTRKFASPMQRASVLIEEMAAQSFLLPNGRRFHFIALLNDLQNPLNITNRNQSGVFFYIPDFTIHKKYELLMGYRFNDGNYRFNKPITTLNTLTISIGDPAELLVIPKYEYLNATLSLADPISGFSNGFNIILDEPHNLDGNLLYDSPGPYSIFIDDLSSDNPADSAWVDMVNKTEWAATLATGANTLFCNYLMYPPGYYIGLPGFIIKSNPQGNLSKVRVRINSFRIIINLELEHYVYE